MSTYSDLARGNPIEMKKGYNLNSQKSAIPAAIAPRVLRHFQAIKIAMAAAGIRGFDKGGRTEPVGESTSGAIMAQSTATGTNCRARQSFLDGVHLPESAMKENLVRKVKSAAMFMAIHSLLIYHSRGRQKYLRQQQQGAPASSVEKRR